MKRGSISAAASAYFGVTQECRQQIYNLPSLPKDGVVQSSASSGSSGHRRRASQPRVASLAGAHGFDSRHTLQTAIGLAAAVWDTFLHLMEQSGDVIGVIQSFVTSFEALPTSVLRSEHHDEILSADIPASTLSALQALHPDITDSTDSGSGGQFDAGGAPSARVHSLLARLRRWLRDHPAWKGVADQAAGTGSRVPSAPLVHTAGVQLSWQEVDDCLERFVTGKLHRTIAHPTAYPDGDTLNSFLELRCRALRTLVGWEQLDCSPPPVSAPLAWQLAVAWLQAVPRFAAPCDKLNCMLNSCSVVSKLLSHSYSSEGGTIRTAKGAQVGADDFLPSLIYVILQAAVPSMYSDLQYVQAYRDKTQLLSENGYYFTNITSACNFVASATPQQLRLRQEQVQQATQAALHAMQATAERLNKHAASSSDTDCVLQSQAAAWEESLVLQASAAVACSSEQSLGNLRGLCAEQQACCDALLQSTVDSSVLATLGLGAAAAAPPSSPLSQRAGTASSSSPVGLGQQQESELILAAMLEDESSESEDQHCDTPAAHGVRTGAAGSALEYQALRAAKRALRALPEAKLTNKTTKRLLKLRESVGNSAPKGEFESQLARLRAVLVDAQLVAAL